MPRARASGRTASAAPAATVLVRLMVGGVFLADAHESRTDFAMILGSLFLLLVGPGRLSLGAWLAQRRSVSLPPDGGVASGERVHGG